MRIQDSILPVAHIHVADTDYNVYISVCTVTRHMHIFKYNDRECAYELFDNQADACQFIEEPLPGTQPKRLPRRGQ